MKSFSLLIFSIILPNVFNLNLPVSNFQTDELKCINYFLNNLTDFPHHKHLILLFMDDTIKSQLENIFLNTQIVNRSMSMKLIDDTYSEFDGQSFYVLFMSETEIERIGSWLNQAKGSLHIVFDRDIADVNQFEKNFLKIVNTSRKTSEELLLFLHLKFENKWKLYKLVKKSYLINFEMLGECSSMAEYFKHQKPSCANGFRVKSSSIPPFMSFSELNGFHDGIEYNLLQLISKKLQQSLHFEYLNATTYHGILQQIIDGNLSEPKLVS